MGSSDSKREIVMVNRNSLPPDKKRSASDKISKMGEYSLHRNGPRERYTLEYAQGLMGSLTMLHPEIRNMTMSSEELYLKQCLENCYLRPLLCLEDMRLYNEHAKQVLNKVPSGS